MDANRRQLNHTLKRHEFANWKDWSKLIIGALIYPVQTRRWRDFVSGQPHVRLLAEKYPLVLHKIYRPYLSMDLDCTARINAMMGHFKHVDRLGLNKLMLWAAHEPVSLAVFHGKFQSEFALQLVTTNFAHREGEWSLQLVHRGDFLFRITFGFGLVAGRPSIQVGSLQGVAAPDAPSRIRAATKALEGWRPKHLLVAILRDLSGKLGCEMLLLVSNQNRVSVNWHRRRRIVADYDGTWLELGAQMNKDGNFALDCSRPPDRDLVQVNTNKRAQTRRRRQLLKSVVQTAATALDRYRSLPAGTDPYPALPECVVGADALCNEVSRTA